MLSCLSPYSPSLKFPSVPQTRIEEKAHSISIPSLSPPPLFANKRKYRPRFWPQPRLVFPNLAGNRICKSNGYHAHQPHASLEPCPFSLFPASIPRKDDRHPPLNIKRRIRVSDRSSFVFRCDLAAVSPAMALRRWNLVAVGDPFSSCLPGNVFKYRTQSCIRTFFQAEYLFESTQWIYQTIQIMFLPLSHLEVALLQNRYPWFRFQS